MSITVYPGISEIPGDPFGPADGINGSVQYNDAGVLAGAPNFVFDKATGNVGIGTINPRYRLHVNAAVDANLYVRSAADFGAFTGPVLHSVNDANTLNKNLRIESAELTINGSTGGKVGIGLAPQVACHVLGQVAVRSNAGAGPTTGKNLEINYQTSADFAYLQSYDRDANAYKPINFYGSSFGFAPNGSANVTINSSGLGVGASPAYPLDVNGSINFGIYPAFLRSGGLPVIRSDGSAYVVVNGPAGGTLYFNVDAAVASTQFYRAGVAPLATIDNSGLIATSVQEQMETLTPAANAGQALNWSFGGSEVTANGTNALTFSGIRAAPALATHAVLVNLFNNVTWPAAVNWGTGGRPSIAGPAWVSLVTRDGGAGVQATVVWN